MDMIDSSIWHVLNVSLHVHAKQRSYEHHVALLVQELQPSHAWSHRSDLKSSLPPPGFENTGHS